MQRAGKTSQPEHCETDFHGPEGFILIAAGVPYGELTQGGILRMGLASIAIL